MFSAQSTSTSVPVPTVSDYLCSENMIRIRPQIDRVLRYCDTNRIYYEAEIAPFPSRDDEGQDRSHRNGRDLTTASDFDLCDCKYEDPFGKSADQDLKTVKIRRSIPPPCPELSIVASSLSPHFNGENGLESVPNGNEVKDEKSSTTTTNMNGDGFTFSYPNQGHHHDFQSEAQYDNGRYRDFVDCFSSGLTFFAYDEEGSETEARRLVFHQLDHAAYALDHLRTSYANSVKEVVFKGHFHHISPAFQILSQLSSVEKVVFNLEYSRIPFMLEKEDQVLLSGSMMSTSVRVLEISVDPKRILFMKEDDCMTEFTLKKIFTLSAKLLPNLKAVKATSPAGFMKGLQFLQSIVHNAQFQEDFQIVGTAIPGELCLMQIDFRMNSENEVAIPILSKVRTPDFDQTNQINLTLEGIYLQLERLSDALSEFKKSRTAEKIFGKPMPGILINQTQPLINCFTARELFCLHKCSRDEGQGQRAKVEPDPIKTMDQVIQDLYKVWKEVDDLKKGISSRHIPTDFVQRVGSYINYSEGEATTRL